MLNDNGFDLWADGYDRSVGLSDEDGTYPFAGYRELLNRIYGGVLAAGAKRILDIGFGTGTLTAKLYEQGCEIHGQDFSERMIGIAREKMPDAKLYQGDFSRGLVPELRWLRYDAIVATYSLHHLTDGEKVTFLKSLRQLLEEGGCIYIGDVAFASRADLEACRERFSDEWDEEEIYLVAGELRQHFPELIFEQISCCAGLVKLYAER